ncbi:E-selectin-like [Glandiceps talaboti]
MYKRQLNGVLLGLVCLAWFGTPSAAQDCTALRPPTNGLLSTTSVTHGTGVLMACDAGYTAIGGSTLIFCYDGTWSDTLADCLADCAVLTAPANGALSSTNVTSGTIVDITCNTGYLLSGDAQTNCTDGNWSDTIPTCLADCPALTAPIDGDLSTTDVTSGITVDITCDTRYSLSGDAQRTCTDGTWSGTMPTCQADCPALTAPTNGAWSSTDVTSGTTVDITCATGYSLSGDAQRTCTDGTWSGTMPTCLADCTALQPPTNGAISTASVTSGTSVTLTCDAAFNAVGGITTIICYDGAWSNNLADCLQEVGMCANGNGGCAGTCTNTPDSFFCSCGIGYTLNADGLACDDVNECLIGNDGCDEICTNIAGSFTCSCSSGYTMNADGQGCDDIDECAASNGGCTDTCTNTVGSFICSCGIGYTLNGDSLTCNAIGSVKGQCNQSSSLVTVLSCLVAVFAIALIISVVFNVILKRRQTTKRSEPDNTKNDGITTADPSLHHYMSVDDKVTDKKARPQARTRDVNLEMSEEIGRTGSTNQTYEVEMPEEGHYKNKNVSAGNKVTGSSANEEEARRTRDSKGLSSEGIYETMPGDTDLVPGAKDSEGYMSLIR